MEDFPRTIETVKRKRDNDVLFRRKVKKPHSNTVTIHRTLGHNQINEGAVLLACIRNISTLALNIEYPGLCYASVTLNNMSDVFSAFVMDQFNETGNADEYLHSIFRVGQFLPAKVVLVGHNGKGDRKIQATVNPRHIYKDRRHNSFKINMTVWCCVQAELDHGYELTAGVDNCRIFLPTKYIECNKKYVIGELLYCIVQKVVDGTTATTLTVSARKKHLYQSNNNPTTTIIDGLDDLTPGTKVDFLVDEITRHGVKGTFYGKYSGYIDESQLNLKNEIIEGAILGAHVLFTEPLTKMTYLSLRGLESSGNLTMQIGDVLSTKILTNWSKGLYVKFEQGERGFVTNKRLLNCLPKKQTDSNVAEAVKQKYPVGSKHLCRIIGYSQMEHLYICTFEMHIIKEKFYLAKDLDVGQRVTVKIEEIVPKGLVVKVGCIRGFVPNLHSTNGEYTKAIKRKYTVGKLVEARVLYKTIEDNVIFTLKQGLVDSDCCLSKIEDVQINMQATGFVKSTNKDVIIIGFYGNLYGLINNDALNVDNNYWGYYMTPEQYFFHGQVVNVWISGIENGKIQLSLLQSKVDKLIDNVVKADDVDVGAKAKVVPVITMKRPIMKVGHKMNATISSVNKISITVDTKPYKMKAIIPVAHLSDSLRLCPILLKTYKVGEKIKDLVCLKNNGVLPILSKREFNRSIPQFHKLQPGMVLRCSFVKRTDHGIYVSVHVQNYDEDVVIFKRNFFKGRPCPKLYRHQCILATVLSVDKELKKITLVAKQFRLNFDGNFMGPLKLPLLTQELEDQNRIVLFGRANNWKLTEYEIGQRVNCTVREQCSNDDYLLSLPNGVIGLVQKHLCNDKMKLAKTYEGVVLAYDFKTETVLVSLKASINKKINTIQNGIISKKINCVCRVHPLLSVKSHIIGVITNQDCNRQLIYLPLYLSENDFVGIDKSFYLKNKLKTVLSRFTPHGLFGFPRKLMTQLLKKKTSKLLRLNNVSINNNNSECKEDIVITEIKDEIVDVDYINGNHIDTDADEVKEEVEVKDEIDEVKEEIDENGIVISTGFTMPMLPGINSFYQSIDQEIKSSSSDDDDDNDNDKIQTTEIYMEQNKPAVGMTVDDDFGNNLDASSRVEYMKKLLSWNSNSIDLWLKYIECYASNGDLDEARRVGMEALQTIDATLITDTSAIWMALLDLENLHGNKESFDSLFDDAVKSSNDALGMYLHVVKMLANSGKYGEMEEKINRIKFKFGTNTQMWLKIAKIYYSLAKFKEGRNIKQNAIKSISDKQAQFNLIVDFAKIEFECGEMDQAVANFEQILDIYPLRDDMWLLYAEELVKLNEIDMARSVFARAVCQSFPIQSMKTVFQAYMVFEEKYGNAGNVIMVRKLAENYVKQHSSNNS